MLQSFLGPKRPCFHLEIGDDHSPDMTGPSEESGLAILSLPSHPIPSLKGGGEGLSSVGGPPPHPFSGAGCLARRLLEPGAERRYKINQPTVVSPYSLLSPFTWTHVALGTIAMSLISFRNCCLARKGIHSHSTLPESSHAGRPGPGLQVRSPQTCAAGRAE